MPDPRRAANQAPRRRLLAGALAAATGALLPPAHGAQVRDWPAGRTVPALELADLDGKPFSLAAQRGRPVLLNFWASWCGPCRDEMPSLELLGARHEAEGLRIVTVNYQEPERSVRRFLEQIPVGLTILMDRDGSVTRAWTPLVFPTSVMIGRDGRPRRTIVGEVDWGGATAREWMAAWLGEGRRG